MFENLIRPADEKCSYGISFKLVKEPVAVEMTSTIQQKQPQPQPSNKPKFKVHNWFTRLVDQRGEDYILSGKLTSEDVNRGVGRIIDDIIYGRIDYIQQGKYLLQPSVIDTLISYCHNKLAISYALQYAIGCAYNTNIPIQIGSNLDQAKFIVNQDIYIYDILYNRLRQCKLSNNAMIMHSVSSELNTHKKALRTRY